MLYVYMISFFLKGFQRNFIKFFIYNYYIKVLSAVKLNIKTYQESVINIKKKFNIYKPLFQ